VVNSLIILRAIKVATSDTLDQAIEAFRFAVG
jgi:hypothetical protein